MTISDEAVQTSYDFRPPVAQEGELVDFQTSTDGLEIGDKVATVVIPFGRAVFAAAATPNQVVMQVLPSTKSV